MIKHLFLILSTALGLNFAILAAGSSVLAQNGFPEPQDRYINDYIDIITPQDEQRIRALLVDLEERSDVEGTVVTIGSISDYPTSDTTIESFALGLFNEWGIGNQTTNDGMLVLVALDDRELRIELGSDNRNEYNTALQQIIDEDMLPLFSEGEFSQGILLGTEATIERIIGPRERAKESGVSTFPTPVTQSSDSITAESEPSNSAEEATTSSGSGFSIPLWGWLVGTVGVILTSAIGFNFYRINQRTRPRKCPNCDDWMEMLDEDEDDLYLDSGQKVEEYLKSVDYDVWVCPTDGVQNVYPHEPMFSKYSKCPKCSYQTVDKYDQILEQPTLYSTGQKQIVADCQHCDYHRAETVILPRIQRPVATTRSRSGGGWSSSPSTRSSSSSRSSRTFGGGRGGGGGASGSW